MPRPRDGKQIKKVYSVRLEPKQRDALVKKFGSLAAALTKLLEKK